MLNGTNIGFAAIFSLIVAAADADQLPVTEHLSDLSDRIEWLQDWGELGFDEASHYRRQPGPQFGIGNRRYKKGLGTAPGTITVHLGGHYSRFGAEVGVQSNAGAPASVVFQAFVDGEKRFDSGLMKIQDSPRAVSTSLQGAQELLLVVTDGGDGISCDQANWAEARLTRDSPLVTEHLSDLPDQIEWVQDWGELGFDEASYSRRQPGPQFGIGNKHYKKGLGAAPGTIAVYLAGHYSRFEAEVGVQSNAGAPASVVFQAFVDGEKRFDSGLMKIQDSPRAVSISLPDAQELLLVVTDGGDGSAGDQANWAEARLTRNPNAAGETARLGMDVGQFARVVTWDANRMTGPKASRVASFLAEDLFLESDVPPSTDGTYTVPKAQNGLGCIGLQWLARRAVRRLEIDFADGYQALSPGDVKAQYWHEDWTQSVVAAGSLWQGHWEELKGSLEQNGNQWIFTPDWDNVLRDYKGVWKIRWVFPEPSEPVVIRRLSAFTNTPVRTAELVFQAENPAEGTYADIEIHNGEIDSAGHPTHCRWDLSKPLHLNVRYAATTLWKFDRTVVRMKCPAGACAVAVDDVLSNGCVYVKDHGVFVASKDAGVTLAEHRKKIAGLHTIPEQVSSLPDQTLQQALERILRLPSQNSTHLPLSLAGDNHKLQAHRDGTILFKMGGETATEGPPYLAQIRPTFGSGNTESLTRKPHAGWLPIPVTSVADGGLVYQQRTFVAPYDRSGTGPGAPWLNDQSLGVMEITVENPGDEDEDALVKLSFCTDTSKQQYPELRTEGSCILGHENGRLFTYVDASQASTLSASVAAHGLLTLSGTIPGKSSARCYVYIPMWDVKPDDYKSLTGGESLVARVEAYWQRLMAPAMQVDIPDAQLMNVILSSQVYCMISTRNEAEGARFALWDGDDRYGPLLDYSSHGMLGLDLMGHHEFVGRCLDYFINMYNSEGYVSSSYTLMGTAWHMWTVAQHFELSADRQWLDRHATDFARVCRWMMGETEKTKRLDSQGREVSVYGLVPPGVLADWDAFAYYFCMNGYYYAGLKNAGDMLDRAGHDEAKAFLSAADELRSAIMRAYRATQALTPVIPLRNGISVPGNPGHVHCPAPMGDFYPSEDMDRSWCYDVDLGAQHLLPMGVMDPDSSEADWLVDNLEDVQFLVNRGPFSFYPDVTSDPFNMGGFSKVQPYITRVPQMHALRDEVKLFIRAYFNGLATGLNTETLSSSEHPAGTGAPVSSQSMGHFLEQTRMMLLMERGDDLYLAPFVPDYWLKDGLGVSVAQAPTRFGNVGYKIRSHAAEGYIEAEIDTPTRRLPTAIVLRLRHPDGKPIKSATVNGKTHGDFDPVRKWIRIKPVVGTMTVRAQY